MATARHPDRGGSPRLLPSLIICSLLFLVILAPSASAAGVNKRVFRYGAEVFLALALVPVLFRILRLDTRPWSPLHRGDRSPDGKGEDGASATPLPIGTAPAGAGPVAPGQVHEPNTFHRLSDLLFRRYHPVFGFAGFLCVVLHGALEGRCNPVTFLALIMLSGYVMTGWAVYTGEPWVGDLRTNRMYHVSQVVAVIFVIVAMGGHLGGD